MKEGFLKKMKLIKSFFLLSFQPQLFTKLGFILKSNTINDSIQIIRHKIHLKIQKNSSEKEMTPSNIDNLINFTLKRKNNTKTTNILINNSNLSDLMQFSLLNKQVIISILHTDIESFGGVQKYLWEDTPVLNKEHVEAVYIFPIFDINNKKSYGISINNFTITKNLDFDMLISLLRIILENHQCTIAIHHLLNWDINDIKTILENSQYIMYIHDIFWLHTDKFNQLFSSNSSISTQDVYNAFFRELCQNSLGIIFPSSFLKQKYIKSKITFFSTVKEKLHVEQNLLCSVQSNPENKKINKKLRIAYLGYESLQKGWALFQYLSQNNSLQEKYDFYHIGSDIEVDNKGFISIQSNYKENDKKAEILLRKHNIDIVLLFSEIEESYSYTMYEAASAGCAIITSNKSGNIQENIFNNHIYGKVYDKKEEVESFLTNQNNVKEWIENNNLPIFSIKHNASMLKYIKGKK